MFLYVDDVAAERRRLQGPGIVLGDDIEGDYSTLAQVRDPDGNLLTLATPPSRPFPPHDRLRRARHFAPMPKDRFWPKAGLWGPPPLPRDFRPGLNDALSAVTTHLK
jgi:hypothetical protein